MEGTRMPFGEFSPLDVLAAAASLQSARGTEQSGQTSGGDADATADGGDNPEEDVATGTSDTRAQLQPLTVSIKDNDVVNQKDHIPSRVVDKKPGNGHLNAASTSVQIRGQSRGAQSNMPRVVKVVGGSSGTNSTCNKLVAPNSNGRPVVSVKDATKMTITDKDGTPKTLTVLRINKTLNTADHSYAFSKLEKSRSEEDEGYCSRSSLGSPGQSWKSDSEVTEPDVFESRDSDTELRSPAIPGAAPVPARVTRNSSNVSTVMAGTASLSSPVIGKPGSDLSTVSNTRTESVTCMNNDKKTGQTPGDTGTPVAPKSGLGVKKPSKIVIVSSDENLRRMFTSAPLTKPGATTTLSLGGKPKVLTRTPSADSVGTSIGNAAANLPDTGSRAKDPSDSVKAVVQTDTSSPGIGGTPISLSSPVVHSGDVETLRKERSKDCLDSDRESKCEGDPLWPSSDPYATTCRKDEALGHDLDSSALGDVAERDQVETHTQQLTKVVKVSANDTNHEHIGIVKCGADTESVLMENVIRPLAQSDAQVSVTKVGEREESTDESTFVITSSSDSKSELPKANEAILLDLKGSDKPANVEGVGTTPIILSPNSSKTEAQDVCMVKDKSGDNDLSQSMKKDSDSSLSSFVAVGLQGNEVKVDLTETSLSGDKDEPLVNVGPASGSNSDEPLIDKKEDVVFVQAGGQSLLQEPLLAQTSAKTLPTITQQTVLHGLLADKTATTSKPGKTVQPALLQGLGLGLGKAKNVVKGGGLQSNLKPRDGTNIVYLLTSNQAVVKSSGTGAQRRGGARRAQSATPRASHQYIIQDDISPVAKYQPGVLSLPGPGRPATRALPIMKVDTLPGTSLVAPLAVKGTRPAAKENWIVLGSPDATAGSFGLPMTGATLRMPVVQGSIGQSLGSVKPSSVMMPLASMTTTKTSTVPSLNLPLGPVGQTRPVLLQPKPASPSPGLLVTSLSALAPSVPSFFNTTSLSLSIPPTNSLLASHTTSKGSLDSPQPTVATPTVLMENDTEDSIQSSHTDSQGDKSIDNVLPSAAEVVTPVGMDRPSRCSSGRVTPTSGRTTPFESRLTPLGFGSPASLDSSLSSPASSRSTSSGKINIKISGGVVVDVSPSESNPDSNCTAKTSIGHVGSLTWKSLPSNTSPISGDTANELGNEADLQRSRVGRPPRDPRKLLGPFNMRLNSGGDGDLSDRENPAKACHTYMRNSTRRQKQGGRKASGSPSHADLSKMKQSALGMSRLHPLIDHDYCMFSEFSAEIQSSIIATTETKQKTERKYVKKPKTSRIKASVKNLAIADKPEEKLLKKRKYTKRKLSKLLSQMKLVPPDDACGTGVYEEEEADSVDGLSPGSPATPCQPDMDPEEPKREGRPKKKKVPTATLR